MISRKADRLEYPIDAPTILLVHIMIDYANPSKTCLSIGLNLQAKQRYVRQDPAPFKNWTVPLVHRKTDYILQPCDVTVWLICVKQDQI